MGVNQKLKNKQTSAIGTKRVDNGKNINNKENSELNTVDNKNTLENLVNQNPLKNKK